MISYSLLTFNVSEFSIELLQCWLRPGSRYC